MAEKEKLSVLIFGATGMLGSSLFRLLSAEPDLEVFGTIRNSVWAQHFEPALRGSLIHEVHVEGDRGILEAFSIARPQIVINCVGIIKQLAQAKNHLRSIEINAKLPHRLAEYSALFGARFIHFSTDCVFSGNKGFYEESDFPDADDLYGRTKLLGEVDRSGAITLRTSIIGHELATQHSLIDWFLNQTGEVKGYRKAVFSGLPTVEVAKVLREIVIPHTHLEGVYHLSTNPISKHDLLGLVADVYGKSIAIKPDTEVVIDRSLNSSRFRSATGFSPRSWPTLVSEMHSDFMAKQSALL